MMTPTCKYCGSVLFSVQVAVPEFRKYEPALVCPKCDKIERKRR